ncbi:MAG: hypothetical protein M1358_13965 [Chloroflexi bacterium]|nr:hypothetical protein [Chloroflexota bacterium]
MSRKRLLRVSRSWLASVLFVVVSALVFVGWASQTAGAIESHRVFLPVVAVAGAAATEVVTFTPTPSAASTAPTPTRQQSSTVTPVSREGVFSEDFARGIVNPAVWLAYLRGSGPAIAVADERMQITIPATSSHTQTVGSFAAGADSVCQLTGEFDMQVDYILNAWPSHNGVRVGLTTGYTRAGVGAVERLDFNGGEVYAADFLGTQALTNTNDLSGKLRMARTGTTITGYYFNPGTGQWVRIGSHDGPEASRDVPFGLGMWSHSWVFGHQEARVAFDNFIVTRGELVCDATPTSTRGISPTTTRAGTPTLGAITTPSRTPTPARTLTPAPTQTPTSVPISRPTATATSVDQLPVIVRPQAEQVFQVRVGETFFLQVDAYDPDGQGLAYMLHESPTGMELNPVTGSFSWLPTSPFVGQRLKVVFSVAEWPPGQNPNYGHEIYRTFFVDVLGGVASPTLTPTSTPVPSPDPVGIRVVDQEAPHLAQIIGEAKRILETTESNGALALAETASNGILGIPQSFRFSINLQRGMNGVDVKYLQTVLNRDGCRLADTGPGSPGNETSYFGSLTQSATVCFQEKYSREILAPWGLTNGTGIVGQTTRARLNSTLAAVWLPVDPPKSPIIKMPSDLTFHNSDRVTFSGTGTKYSTVYLEWDGGSCSSSDLLCSAVASSNGTWVISNVPVRVGINRYSVWATKDRKSSRKIQYFYDRWPSFDQIQYYWAQEVFGNPIARVVIGQPENIAEFAGSLTLDVVGVGDVRDFTAEAWGLIVHGDGDMTVFALSGAGIMTTFIPQNDVALSALKNTVKVSRRLGTIANVVEEAALRVFTQGRFSEARPLFKLSLKLQGKSAAELDLYRSVLRSPEDVMALAKAVAKHGDDVIEYAYRKGFANEVMRVDHFQRHGSDFGVEGVLEYELLAKTFLNRPSSSTLITKTRVTNGDIVRFDTTTEHFGVKASDGTIRTFYKPNPAQHGFPTNLDYFNAQ